MSRHRFRNFALALLLGLAVALPVRAETQGPALSSLVARLLPSVVAIKTSAVTTDGRTRYEFGSGFIVDPSGVIATNRHVIAGADHIYISGHGFEQVPAKVLFQTNQIDLAVLKIDVPQTLPAVTFGDSDQLRIGDPVMVIGNPLGIGESVSIGIVSALDRDLRISPYDDFIQTDAAINHGNSGGGMFDMDGKLIGVASALISSEGNTGSVGLGFALPANDAKFAIDQVIKTGEVHAGWFGVQSQTLSDKLAEAFGMKAVDGVIVTGVDPSGPAAGKLQVGDVIVGLDKNYTHDVRSLARLVATTPIGTKVPVQFIRDGKTSMVDITVADVSRSLTNEAEIAREGTARLALATAEKPGMTLTVLTPELRTQYKLPDWLNGVLVTNIVAGTSAADVGIRAGDVITRLGDQQITTPEQLTSGLRAVSEKKQGYAALLVNGGRSVRWVALQVAPAS
jgi:serine protease Do